MTDLPSRLNAALSDRYRIERELGQGGMATVYLAEDLRHARQVAIKVLKPELAAVVGGERFLATTANLQHPHILPLFDSGDADGFLFYVIPYLKGESLRARLDREKQLPVEEAVGIAVKVAGALQAAHDRGIVHRDIKPANILLGERGEPLVADFGIALAVQEAGGGRLTETGLSLGTPHYMSPEQATGDGQVGLRSDLYALGCVLHEMLAGEPPFTGASAQAVLGRILTEDPRDLSAVRRSVPPHVAATVARALEKLPADRFPSAEALVRALQDPGFHHRVPTGEIRGAGGSGTSIGAAPRTGGARARTSFAVTVGGVALAGLVVGGVLGRVLSNAPEPERSFQTAMALPQEQAIIDPPFGSSIALSDDGETLLYAGTDDGSGLWQFWIRRAGDLRATPVPGTSGAFTPTLSPSGDAVAFVAQSGDLVVLGLSSGARQVLAEAANFVADWAEDGYIYFTDNVPNFFRVRAEGGEPEPLPGLTPSLTLRWTFGEALPGGTHGVWTRLPASFDLEGATIAVVDFETGAFTELARGGTPRYLRSGHLAWTTPDGVLQAAPFDAGSGELTGTPVPLVDRILIGATGAAFVSFSQNGDLVYRTGSTLAGVMQPAWVDAGGATTPVDPEWRVLPAAAGNWSGLAVSPGGDRIVTTDGTGGGSQLWVKDTGSDAPPTRITFDGDFNVRPRWSPTGDTIFYISAPSGINPGGGAVEPTGVWAKAADGSGAAREVLSMEVEIEEAVVTPDGQWLVYRQGGTTEGRDIHAVRLDGSGDAIPVAASGADEKSPQLSADGRWIAYVSDVTGTYEVFVRPFPDASEGVWQISQGGGVSPVWNREDNTLHYLGTQGGLSLLSARLAVDGDAVRVAARDSVFPITSQYVDPNYLSFDTGPDDTFVFYSFGQEEEGELVWHRNWLASWRARAGELR
jgi:serine/threonine-protein kinase